MNEKIETAVEKRLRRLSGPIPPQGLIDALARAKCDACADCTPKKEMECRKTFSAQALAVTAFIRSVTEGAA